MSQGAARDGDNPQEAPITLKTFSALLLLATGCSGTTSEDTSVDSGETDADTDSTPDTASISGVLYEFQTRVLLEGGTGDPGRVPGDPGDHPMVGPACRRRSALPKTSVGPICFNESVAPDPTLQVSSIDGGVLWVNAPAPAVYTLSATDPDGQVSFEETAVTCEPGRLINISPPHGLQAF